MARRQSAPLDSARPAAGRAASEGQVAAHPAVRGADAHLLGAEPRPAVETPGFGVVPPNRHHAEARLGGESSRAAARGVAGRRAAGWRRLRRRGAALLERQRFPRGRRRAGLVPPRPHGEGVRRRGVSDAARRDLRRRGDRVRLPRHPGGAGAAGGGGGAACPDRARDLGGPARAGAAARRLGARRARRRGVVRLARPPLSRS